MTRAMFIGSKQLGIEALRIVHDIAPDNLARVATIEDTNDDERSELQEFRALTQRMETRLEVLDRPSQLDAVIDEVKPDLCLVVGWYWIIPSEVLQGVPQGVLGIHNSVLPKYRGGAPLVWAIINDEAESGVSLFYLDDGMDTGDLVAQASFAIEPDDAIGAVLARAVDATEQVLTSTYPSLLDGSAKRWSQKHEEATYGAMRRPEDGELDWSMTHLQVHNHIRAQSKPYPGAFTYLDDQKISMWKARPFERKYYGSPGQIVQIVEDGAVVTCGSGAVVLQETNPGGLRFGQQLGRSEKPDFMSHHRRTWRPRR